MHILLIASKTLATMTPTPSEITNSMAKNSTTPDNLIGIGGIIATVIVGFITWLVTWKLTMKTIQQLKLSYDIQHFPILSNAVAKSTEINLIDFQIKYKDKLLSNPCLLTLDIINTGNRAIMNPPIKIRNDENIEIIPGYFEDMPPGYEDRWTMNKEDSTSCSLSLEHINPKQIVKARLFLNKSPKEEIIFECPMPDIQKQKMNNKIEYTTTTPNTKTTFYKKTNTVLILITVMLFITIEYWRYFIDKFIYTTNLENHLLSFNVVIFVMSILLLSIILNTYGLKNTDRYIIEHPKRAKFIKLGILMINFVLLYLIVLDYIIISIIAQLITAIIVVILFALLIHISSMPKK